MKILNIMEEITRILSQIEIAADDIIDDKAQIVNLDRKRQKNREALNLFRPSRNPTVTGEIEAIPNKQWLCIGNMFIKVTTSEAKNLINEDQNNLDKGIESLRDGLKTKVNKLRELEGKEQIKSFNLKPLSREELNGLRTAFLRK